MLAFIFAPMEMLIIGLVMLLIFGNRLPSVMRSLGQGMEEFRRLPPYVQRDLRARATAKTPLINFVLLGLIVVVLVAVTVYWAR